MNKKLLSILIPVILLSSFAISFVTFASPDDIKIGLIGPIGLSQWEPAGMLPAAEMAIKEINDAGGVKVGEGDYRNFTLLPANEWALDTSLIPPNYNEEKARASITALLGQGPQFIIGGFRTEVADDVIEKVMDWNEAHTPVPFFIDGASTNELLPNMTDPTTYARYKWLFRVTPINSTMLFRNICGYLKDYLIPKKLAPMYCNATFPAEHPWKVKFAVVVEDLTWTQAIGANLMNPYVYPYLLGSNVTTPSDNSLYFRVSTDTTDFTSVLNQINAAGAHLIITSFTLPMANTLSQQWQTQGSKSMLVGISVQAQLQTHPEDCGYDYEYEVIMNTAGTNTSIVPGKTDVFFTNFMSFTDAKYPSGPYHRVGGWWPIYTAYGAYDAIYALKETIEAAQSVNPNTLLSYFEATNRIGISNRFVYTGWHDVYTKSFGENWTDDYTRAMMVQWVNETLFKPSSTKGYMSVVSPIDKIYSHKTLIPDWVYALGAWDINFDGTVDMKDIRATAKNFGASYGDVRWNIENDINLDSTIDMKDIRAIAKHFGNTESLWPLRNP